MNLYLNKEIFRIWQSVTDFQQWTKNNILSLPIINQLSQFSPFGHFIGIIDKIENSDFGKVVKCFLEALHGINRAYNSYKYKDLLKISNKELKSLKFSQDESYLFSKTQQADSFLDKDFLNLQFGENSINIPEFIIPDFLEQWIIDFKKIVSDSLDTVVNKLNPLEEKIKNYKKLWFDGLVFSEQQLSEFLDFKSTAVKLRKDHKHLKKVLQQFNSSPSYSQKNLVIPQEFKSKSAIVLVPSITGTLTTIGGMATFFLSLMGITTATGIGVALKHFVTSIVTNFFNSSGTIVSRYMTAAILRFNKLILPAIFQKSGMSGTAWIVLMQYALPILFAALLIITLIKSKLAIGNHIYIYGDGDTQLTILDDLDENIPISHVEVNQVLTEKKLSQLSQKTYQEYYGFSVDSDNRVIYGLDLNTNLPLLNADVFYSSCFKTE